MIAQSLLSATGGVHQSFNMQPPKLANDSAVNLVVFSDMQSSALTHMQ